MLRSILSGFTLKKQIKVIYEEKEVNSQEIKKEIFLKFNPSTGFGLESMLHGVVTQLIIIKRH